MIGDGNQYVIFDCKNPSYLNRDHKLIVIKNHVLNDEIKRQNHPMNKLKPQYLCNKTTSVWSITRSKGFEHGGYVAFDDANQKAADLNFDVLTEEKFTRDYFKQLKKTKPQITDKDVNEIVDLIFYLTHHPSHYKQDSAKGSKEIDSNIEKGGKIPDNLIASRKELAKIILEKMPKNIEKTDGFQKEYVGDGFTFILFDCEHPKYLFPMSNGNEKYEVRRPSENFLRVLPEVGYCDKEDNIWKRTVQKLDEIYPTYLTIDAKQLDVGFAPLASFIVMMKKTNMCDDYMKFFLHPAYWNKKFKKPVECSAEAKLKEDSEVIDSILSKNTTPIAEASTTKKRRGSNTGKKLTKLFRLKN